VTPCDPGRTAQSAHRAHHALKEDLVQAGPVWADGYECETDRLLLRRWRADDLEDLEAVFAKPEVWWYPDRRGRNAGETRAFLDRRIDLWRDRGWSHWAVEHREDGRVIGFLGLEPPTFLPEVMPTVEVGWRLDPDYWGRGLATEGGRAALRFGFDVLGVDEIVSIYEPENVASGRVMQRIGMRRDRDTTHPTLGVDLRVYKLLRTQWDGSGR
jgi:RimJ/RimL family protein N-acetyltransferase